jgi:poly-gamma-glutamate capsule biosynthesis protein CapA/YwtB (metallophosphatase superfamily)
MKGLAARPYSASVNAFLYCVSLLALTCYNSQASAEDPWPWTGAASEDAVTLLLLGDFNVQKRENPADALEHVRQTLNDADLVYANLEGLLVESRGADKDLPNKSGWTHLGPDTVDALVAGNVAVVGVANNVAFGRDNILASLSVLDAHGIAHTGAGANIDQAHEPAIIEVDGVKFGFLQYTSKWYDESQQIATESAPGVARLASPDGNTVDPADLERMLADIRRTRPKVDILVVSAHTRDGQRRDGSASNAAARSSPVEAPADLYSRLPVNRSLEQFEPYQTQLAHAAIDAGADVVFGHGCHSLQAVATYDGRPVMYCLGNFASDWIRVRDYRDGLVARVVIANKQLKRVSLVPVTRDAEENNVRLVAPDADEGGRLYDKLRHLSPRTRLALDGQELVLLENP